MRIENSISFVVHALALALQEAFENGWESVIFEYSDGGAVVFFRIHRSSLLSVPSLAASTTLKISRVIKTRANTSFLGIPDPYNQIKHPLSETTASGSNLLMQLISEDINTRYDNDSHAQKFTNLNTNR